MSEQKYPRWFKSINNGQIVKFDGLQSGEVVVSGAYHKKGAYGRDWTIHTNTDVWQEVPNPELTREHEKAMMIDQDGIDKLLDEVDKLDDKSHLDNILAERGAKYGNFASQAEFAQFLKTTLHKHRNWDELRDSQKEALEMIMHKISRILNGDPNYDDSWRDIAGYAELIVKELNENTIKR